MRAPGRKMFSSSRSLADESITRQLCPSNRATSVVHTAWAVRNAGSALLAEATVAIAANEFDLSTGRSLTPACFIVRLRRCDARTLLAKANTPRELLSDTDTRVPAASEVLGTRPLSVFVAGMTAAPWRTHAIGAFVDSVEGWACMEFSRERTKTNRRRCGCAIACHFCSPLHHRFRVQIALTAPCRSGPICAVGAQSAKYSSLDHLNDTLL